MRTKVQILREREEKAYQAYEKLTRELNGLEMTRPAANQCSSCGVVFGSQFEFDDHYLVDDERYLNLGNCPSRYNNGRLMPSLGVGWGKSLEEYAYEEDEKRMSAAIDLMNRVVSQEEFDATT
jgi:hypothetical protein